MSFFSRQIRQFERINPLIRLRQEHTNRAGQCRYMHFKRAFPQYCINGESALLCFKPIMPQFKAAGQDSIALQDVGRMLLEFTPSNPGYNGYSWDDKKKIALSVEEIGLLISTIPNQPLKLSRDIKSDLNNSKYDSISVGNDLGRKVLCITPEEYSIVFSIDHVGDSLSAQGEVPGGSIEVAMQAGEWEVVKSTLKASIPYLLGWNHMMDIATTSAMDEVARKK